MKRYNLSINRLAVACLLLGLLAITSCKEEEYAVPAAKTALQNDVIKRTLGPNVAGLDIEFAYAMALAPERGKLVSAQVEASIAGGEGTYLENRSYYTDGGGNDIGIQIGNPSTSQGNTTTVTFTRDTSAATLRYFYKIPAAAKGQAVSFKFTATASTGETVTYDMGPYQIAKMDMSLDLPVKDATNCFISLEDMRVYSAEEAASNAGKIDLVYLYRSIPGITFTHALVSPGAGSGYLPGVALPSGANNVSKIRKEWGLRDFHLARLQFGIYIDDLDFEKLTMTDMPAYAINLRAESGAWVESADGRYRAYVYLNSVNSNGSAVISIKRYTL